MKRPLLVLFVLLFFAACTKEKVPPDVPRLEAGILAGKKQMSTIDEKLKDSDADQGTKIELAQEKELLKSRVERLKVRLSALGGKLPDEGGGEHGGEAH